MLRTVNGIGAELNLCQRIQKATLTILASSCWSVKNQLLLCKNHPGKISFPFCHAKLQNRVTHSVQSKNKNRKIEADTHSIYANCRNKFLCQKSLELDKI